jgi:hypothetical protein
MQFAKTILIPVFLAALAVNAHPADNAVATPEINPREPFVFPLLVSNESNIALYGAVSPLWDTLNQTSLPPHSTDYDMINGVAVSPSKEYVVGILTPIVSGKEIAAVRTKRVADAAAAKTTAVFEEMMRVKDEAESDVIAALAVTLSATFSAQEKIDLAAAMAVTMTDTAMYVAAK